MNKIICNDALTALKSIDDNSVDIVLTSPPYNFDMQYDEHDDKDDNLKYIDTLVNIFNECKRTLKDGGRLLIFNQIIKIIFPHIIILLLS